jgi:hypothetical protein
VAKPTDLTILNALLAAKSKLSLSEVKVFRSMFEGLQGGGYVSLSKAQRLWAEKKFCDLGLDRLYADKAPPPYQSISKNRGTSVAPPPKALKPPGR